MKTIGTFFVVILITVLSAFLNGWFWMMGYELGIAPLINYLDVAPSIPYMLFVLLCLAWSLIKSKKVDYDKATKITEAKFWAKYFGVIFTDLLILGILWVFNLLVVG
jgi:hypothetical protein